MTISFLIGCQSPFDDSKRADGKTTRRFSNDSAWNLQQTRLYWYHAQLIAVVDPRESSWSVDTFRRKLAPVPEF